MHQNAICHGFIISMWFSIPSVVWLTLTSPCFISSTQNHDPRLSVCNGMGHISKQYLHALKPKHPKLEEKKKGTISQSINFQMHVVMIKGICPILLYCVSFITLAMVGLLNEWKPIICNACSTWSFFCTLVIIIIVICEQGGRTHNGTFVGGGHGRWSYHWVMSFDPTPLSSVKASLS